MPPGEPRVRRSQPAKQPKTNEEAFIQGLERVMAALWRGLTLLARATRIMLAAKEGWWKLLYPATLLLVWPVANAFIKPSAHLWWEPAAIGFVCMLGVIWLRHGATAMRLEGERAQIESVVRTGLGLAETETPYVRFTGRGSGGATSAIEIDVPHRFRSGGADGFEEHFLQRVASPDGQQWGFDWHLNENRVKVGLRPELPNMVPFREDAWEGLAWNQVPVGVTHDNKIVVWDLVNSPHGLMCGATGSGKSVSVNTVIATLMARDWTIRALDPKETEFFWLQYRAGIEVALDNKPCWEALLEAEKDMRRRKEMLSRERQRFWKGIPGLKPLLVVVDEAFDLLAAKPKDDEEKALQAACKGAIASIARLGRAPGVHLLLVAQRPDAKVLEGELRNNLRGRFLLGSPLSSELLMVFDAAQPPPSHEVGAKGRGWWWQTGMQRPSLVQGFYASDEQLEGIADRKHPRTEEPPDPGLAPELVLTEDGTVKSDPFASLGIAPPPPPGGSGS